MAVIENIDSLRLEKCIHSNYFKDNFQKFLVIAKRTRKVKSAIGHCLF